MLQNIYLRREPACNPLLSEFLPRVTQHDVVAYSDPLCLEPVTTWAGGGPRPGCTRVTAHGNEFRAVWYPDAPMTPRKRTRAKRYKLGRHYEAARQKGLPAWEALAMSRRDVSTGTKEPYVDRFHAWVNGSFDSYGERNCKFIENPAACGLRKVENADKIARIDHTGWYFRHDDYDSLYRGVVYQLAAKHGCPRYLIGYEGDEAGGVLLCFDVIEGTRTDSQDAARDSDEKLRKAAYRADKFAERAAEESREYDEAWQAGSQARSLQDEMSTIRKATIALIRELKTIRKTLCDKPAIISRLRADIENAVEEIGDKRREFAKLLDNFSYSKELQAAFAEGLGG